MKIIPLTKGYEALVDDEDYQSVIQYSWHSKIVPHTVYARRSFSSGTQSLHQFVMNGIEIDHIDRNGLNCQKHNLRFATRSIQAINRKHKNKYRGVFATKNKWIAQLKFQGVVHYFGIFNTDEEAAKAYDKGAKQIHGEFAILNFKE